MPPVSGSACFRGGDYFKFDFLLGANLSGKGMIRRAAKLSHFDHAGRVRMVDVTKKPATSRTAQAHAFIRMKRATVASIRRIKNPKGNPLEIARIAGITAAKRTAELIPLCHPLALTHIDVSAKLCQNGIEITSEATATGPTGVEMEARRLNATWKLQNFTC